MHYYNFRIDVRIRAKNKKSAMLKLQVLTQSLRNEIEPEHLSGDKEQKYTVTLLHT